MSTATVASTQKGNTLGMRAVIFIFLLICSPLLLFGVVFPALLAPASTSNLGALGIGGPAGGPSGPVPTYVPAQIAYQNRTGSYSALVAWLQARNSAMADPQYLSQIEAAGQRWNIDPLLLLAITGQEESFVPKSWNQAILNNPWNVFHSWEEWQGGFGQSAQWAANTVARLSQGCPAGESVIEWVNGFGPDGSRSNPGWGYAGDPHWWVGVSQFYSQLQTVAKGGS